MPHNASQVLMGQSTSSDKDGVKTYASDPATYVAGLAVRVASTGLLSVTSTAGQWAGISMGKSLSDHKKTSVLRAGLGVPVILEAEPARGEVVITSYANLVATTGDTVQVGATTFTAQAGSVTPGQTTFRASTDNATTAASLSSQINAHAVASTVVVASVVSATVTITAKANTVAGNLIDLIYTDTHSEIGATVSGATLLGGGDPADYVAIGAQVYFSDTTGKADDPNSGATISNAVYVSEVLTGIDESGSEVQAALVDMGGGL